jgi:hypothetical protein
VGRDAGACLGAETSLGLAGTCPSDGVCAQPAKAHMTRAKKERRVASPALIDAIALPTTLCLLPRQNRFASSDR